MTHDPPENTVKPGFEIEPIKVLEPEPHDPMDAHWQALIAERDKLKEEVERLKRINSGLTDIDAEISNRNASLVERVSELEHAADSVCQWNWSDNDPEPVADMDRLRTALEKIKFRNHPGTTNHELAKEALNHD
jgi:hypothetical protein